MTPRLAAKIEVSALIRRVESSGGTAAVLARGDAQAGTILLWIAEKGRLKALYGRSLDSAGVYRWGPIGPENHEDGEAIAAYVARRRANDRDLWLVELDIANAERFGAELVAAG